MAEIIHTAETHYAHGQRTPAVILVQRPGDPATILLPAERAAEIAIHAHWHRRDEDAFVPETMHPQPVAAFVNDSRWLVQCPVCNGAQLASRTDHRFFCIDCLNDHAGRQWLPVTWPSEDQQAEIEGLLLRRPLTHTRSWKPDEPTEKLRGENLAHGVAA